jgi:hypothetical protein
MLEADCILEDRASISETLLTIRCSMMEAETSGLVGAPSKFIAAE